MHLSSPAAQAAQPLFALLSRANGHAELSAAAVAAASEGFRFVDVREPHELAGPLGAAEGAENVPFLGLLSTLDNLDREEPLVLICRSGRRSSTAVANLERAGFTAVASVEGGMLAWNLEVLGKTDIVASEKAANAEELNGATFHTNGLPEVSARWVHAHLGRFRLIDVRGADERRMAGYVAQSEHVPLGEVMSSAAGWDKDQPLVIMCASGGRSARATMALNNSGFGNVASLEGGIFGWRAAGLPAVR